MFDVIVDSIIIGVRERAKNGNFDSMVLLAAYLQNGMHTRKNPALAQEILDYVLRRKAEIPFKETYWDALGYKSQIHADRGEFETVEALLLETVRHMTRFPVQEWDPDILQSAVTWLCEWRHLTKTERA